MRQFACWNNLKLHNSNDVLVVVVHPEYGTNMLPCHKNKRLKNIVLYKLFRINTDVTMFRQAL
jgi:hypothetical protein